jgi:hypothetical protein
MIFLVLTAKGAADILAPILRDGHAFWLNAGLPVAVDELRREGWNITRLSYRIDPLDRNAIDDVAWTIREHHPADVILVETVAAIED